VVVVSGQSRGETGIIICISGEERRIGASLVLLLLGEQVFPSEWQLANR
jgi:hypothetical protein